jgi:hypothetical protein
LQPAKNTGASMTALLDYEKYLHLALNLTDLGAFKLM